jgi:phosphoenolpyruvate-protein phosphotransferase (PTS system enzyme I)
MTERMQVLRGLGAAEGVGIGKAVTLQSRPDQVYRFPLPEDQVDAEVDRFRVATADALEEVQKLRTRVAEEMGGELAGIFEAHCLMLRDEALLSRIEQRIRKASVNAEWAVSEVIAELGEQFERLHSERFRERHQDLQDVASQLIRSLQGVSHHELSEIAGDVVVIAHDLTPSEAVRLGRQGVVGFATEGGGRTSHTTIIAHSLGIPLVTGIPGITRLALLNDPVILDGSTGTVILHPTPELLKGYRAQQAADSERLAALGESRELRAMSLDGVEVELGANIDLIDELVDAVRCGADGIGLYRSEFLYIEKSPELPTEEEHFEVYRQLVETMAPSPVVIRTFDLGGRKIAREVLETWEENPVFGLRGVRLTLARPEIFRFQLRGLLRAGRFGNLWIMLPMVSTVEEVRQFRSFLRSVRDELVLEGIPHASDSKLGIMIEVPAAALIADRLAREVDFFSIGTNDLIQYAMAVDRANEHVTHLYQPLHPAILRMVRWTLDHARAAEIPVSVCGEMASEPLTATALLGLGVRGLSLSPRRLPAVKEQIRSLDFARLEKHMEHCLGLSSACEVQEYLEGVLERGESGRGVGFEPTAGGRRL